MENCSKMNEVINTTYNNNSPPLKSVNSFHQGEQNNGLMSLEAHSSKNMKVKRPKITVNELTASLPVQKVFSDKEATKRMQAINTDIYEGAKKEKEKHEFNLKRYATIFGIITLLAAAIAYFRKK